jgi:glycerol-3-phosphate dehydrogenase (NAD(P)+)
MGTLCALLFARRGTSVTLWARSSEFANQLEADRENARYLPDHAFPEKVIVTSDAREAFKNPELIVSAIPCQHIRSLWTRLAEHAPANVPVVSVAKGIEVGTLQRPTQILHALLPQTPVAALSGPCIAGEVADGLPAPVVVASAEEELAERVQRALSSKVFRIYTNTDVIGVELGGAVKNVISIAAGIGDGMHMGCNAKAGLITRGLVEITRLGVALGAKVDTFKGLAGIGDLITTCMSKVSRNRLAGEKIGEGIPINTVVADSHGVIEGIQSTRSILQLAQQHNVEMPITQAIHGVLFDDRSPRITIDELMTRRLRAE